MNIILWMLGLLGVVWGYSQLWTKWIAGKVGMTLQADHPEPLTVGDEVDVWMIVENHSWLAIPRIELSQPLPEGLRVIDGDEWKTEMTYRTYLLPRQRVKRLLRLYCVSRGVHRFQRAHVTFHDGTGLNIMRETWDAGFDVLVRPTLLDTVALPVRLLELMEEQSVTRWYQEDPSRLMGIRSYMPGDPYQHIHWIATARTGELMVKQFETTSETTLYVVMNVQFFEPYWHGSRKAIVDYQCRLAATLFEQASRYGYAYGLQSNASGSIGGGQLTISPGRTPDHLQTILTTLGELWHPAVCSFLDLLTGLRGRLHKGASIIVLTAYWNKEAAPLLEQLRTEGHEVTIVALNGIEHQIGLQSPSISVIPIDVEWDVQEVASA